MTAQKAEVDCEAWYPPHPLQPLTLKPCAGKITISVFGPKGGRFPLVWLVWMILTRALRDRTVGVAVGWTTRTGTAWSLRLRTLRGALDRKSTRLNSSHLVI